MDLTDRLIGHDLWPSLRLPEMLNRPVFTKEVWMTAIHRRLNPDFTDNSLDGLRKRLVAAYGEFTAVVWRVHDEGLWDTYFMDMSCEPPQTFSYGGMIAHVLTFSAFRRTQVIEALKGFEIEDLGFGDPIEWERRQS